MLQRKPSFDRPWGQAVPAATAEQSSLLQTGNKGNERGESAAWLLHVAGLARVFSFAADHECV